MPSWVARTKCTASPLQCTVRSKHSNHAGVIVPSAPGHGYTMTGGGMNNHYRHFNKISAFEELYPHGNTMRCDTGFGSGSLTCYTQYCRRDGKPLTCTTR